MEDMYGSAGQDYFPIDDLLDLSNDDLFSSSTSSTDSDHHHHHHHHPLPPQHHPNPTLFLPPSTDLFSNDLCLPIDDVAELEWLSRFVDDSFTDFPTAELSGTFSFLQNDKSFSTTSRVRTKRSKPVTAANFDSTWAGPSEPNSPKPKPKREAAEPSTTTRRCAHCASEKTPQWRAGPMGPKTLCNACGVRYKSGRLVPEYRPAASPTFVLTQHSNSHRKVMELRRQKEISRPHNHREEPQQQQEQEQEQQQFYLHRNGFQVC